MASDQDTLHADLCELLTVLGMGDHARPQSSHEVFQEALVVLRERLKLASKPGEHWSDCAVHNEPAMSAEPCNCGGLPPARHDGPRETLKALVAHIGAGRYRCSQTGLRLDANIPEFESAEQVLASIDSPIPDNETLHKLGAFDRKCRVGKHQATNWVHLRQTIETLDAAGQSGAADTLIWTVWHEVNSVARAREYYGLEAKRRADVERDYHLMCEEDRRLRAGIAEIIAICEQDARDQDHNAGTTGFGRGSKAYAEGRGTACKGIATRLRALLPLPTPSPVEES